MVLHDVFMKAVTGKAMEAAERGVVDIIVRKLRAQGVRVSRSTRDGIAAAVRAQNFETINVPDSAVRSRKARRRLTFSKIDLRLFERIERRLEKMLPDIVETTAADLAPRILRDLTKGWPERARLEDEGLASFQRHQMRRWGRGFSGLAMMLTITRELGGQLATQYSSSTDGLPHVLVRLHARACTVADEVLVLMQAGLADAANARWRTLHEIAVTCMFLREAGETAAQRFVAHGVVDELKAAKLHQKHARRLGLAPFSQGYMRRLKRTVAKRMTTFGQQFIRPYGWAASGPNDYVRGFEDVESRTALSHWRPSYKTASYQVHASPNAMFEWIALYGRDGVLGGRSMLGVADPGQRTAISLNQATAALAGYSGQNTTFDTIVTLRILRLLCDRTIANLLTAHQRQQRVLGRARQRANPNAP